ncbi:Ank2, partial [Symbiodinium pilosum]
HQSEPWHTAKVRSLIDAGVDTFICLQEHAELRRFTPYMDIAQRLHAEKAGWKAAEGPALEFFHCPTPDQHVTTEESVLRAVKTLASKLQEGRTVYVHCWGGHGRTGTLICSFLTVCYGLTVAQAKDFYMLGERCRPARSGYWPASQAQYDQVTAVASMAVQDILDQAPLLDPLVDWATPRATPASDSGNAWCGCDSISRASKRA